jgi:hypothetical protein
MNRNAIASVLVAALVLLAGCSGGITGSQDGTATDGSTTTAAQSTTGATDSGTLNLYISDEQNAISDFEHLNVTITRVGLNPAGDDGDDADNEDSDDTDESGDETNESDDTENVTATTTETQTESPETETESDDADGGEGEWVEYEVDDRTVDLTRLQGANATKLSSFDVPNGTYEKVFVYVSDVNGTLKDGSDQRVKLPSGKLQLNSEFTVGNGESVDFVFDITAVKAGQSGKYILKPVISESGTDVEIDSVDEDDETGESGADDERGDASERSALNASFVGNVTQGENATISVTQNGSAVANATVAVDGDRVGTTDADGTATISVPDDAEELEVTIARGDAETELTVEFETESSQETQSTTQSSSGGETATATS